MPRDDVILSPRTSAWSVRPTLDEPLPRPRPGDRRSVLVAPIADGPDGDAGAARPRSRPSALDAEAAARHPRAGHHRRARSPPCPSPPARTPCAGSCSSASATGRRRSWRTAGAAVGRATRGAGEVVHAVGDAAPAPRSPAYVEAVVLGLLGLAALDPGGCGRRLRARRGAAVVTGTADAVAVRAGGGAGPRPARRPRAGGDPLEHEEPRLAGRARPAPWRGAPGSTSQVWDERRLRADGFGGILAVGQGSATPAAARAPRPRARGRHGSHTPGRARRQGHHLRHRWACRSSRSTACSGMKTDMSGAAIVLAVLSACRELEVPRAGHRPARHRRERRRGRLLPPRRRRHPVRRAHRRDRQHRRRGPHRHGRRARLRRRPPRPRPGSSTSRR